ncbi:hypothetical protein SUDANB95_05582 [Actinosynnema sp. ALI-1.44]
MRKTRTGEKLEAEWAEDKTPNRPPFASFRGKSVRVYSLRQ